MQQETVIVLDFGGRGNVCAHARDVFSNAHF